MLTRHHPAGDLYRLAPSATRTEVQHMSPSFLTQRRHASSGTSSLPVNVGVMFVPQQEAWVVERMGRYHTILDPGLNFLIPVIDKIKYVQSLKEIAIDIPQQSAITKDNVAISIDGVLYLRIMDPYKASYGVEDPEFAQDAAAQGPESGSPAEGAGGDLGEAGDEEGDDGVVEDGQRIIDDRLDVLCKRLDMLK